MSTVPKIALKNSFCLTRFRNDYLLRLKAGKFFTVSGAITSLTAFTAFPFGFLKRLRREDLGPVWDTDARLDTSGKPSQENKKNGKKWKKRQNLKQRQMQGSFAPASVESATPLILEKPRPGKLKNPQASQKGEGYNKQESSVTGQSLPTEGSCGGVATPNSDIERSDESCVIAAAKDISIGIIDASDPRAHLPIPQRNITMESYNPGHDLLSWTTCYDDSCPVHLSEKNNTGYFPNRPWRRRP